MKKHTKFDWIRIENEYELISYIAQEEKINKEEFRTIISKFLNGDDLSHHRSKTASGALLKIINRLYNGSILQASMNIDSIISETRELQFLKIKSGGIININRVGGWNDSEDFLEDQDGEWIECELTDYNIANNMIKQGNSNFLIIENDTLIDNELYGVLFHIWKNHSSTKFNIERDINILFGWDSFKNTEKFQSFITELIQKYGKLIIIFRTTSLEKEKIEELKKFSKHIDVLYTNQYKIAQKELGNLFKISSLSNEK